MAGYDEFVDPNSAIARIIQQMQGAATRSNPDAITQRGLQGDLQPGEAQPGPVGTGPDMQTQMGMDPQALIEQLLERQYGGQVNR